MATAAISQGDAQSVTPGQMEEFWRQVKTGKINKYIMQCILEGRNPFEIPTDEKGQWELFYKLFFDREIDWEGTNVIRARGEFGQLIFIPKGLLYDEVWCRMSNLFPCWKYTHDDLSKVIDLSREARNTDISYTIRVCNCVRADQVHKNKSAYMVEQEGINGITLLERMIYGMFFWWMSGRKLHLDYNNITLCSGSRCFGGLTLSMHVDSGEQKHISICMNTIYQSTNRLRCREVLAA